jgi:hypothetical protein
VRGLIALTAVAVLTAGPARADPAAPADLAISVTAPRAAEVGETVAVAVAVRNRGTAERSGRSFACRFLLEWTGASAGAALRAR